MSGSDASLRPSALDLSRSQVLLSSKKKINVDLRRELDEQKSLNEQLSRSVLIRESFKIILLLAA